MKQKTVATSVILLVILVVVGGCVIRGPAPSETEAPQEAPAAPEKAAAPVEEPETVIEPIVKPAPTTTSIRQPTTKEGASEAPMPFDKGAEWEMATLDGYKLKRISRDKGEVSEVTFTVRNMGGKKLNPRLVLWFHAQETEDESVQDIQEKVYDLPALEPGYKVTKTYPLTMRFHYLDQQKKFTLTLREKFVSPPKELYRTEKTFIPLDEMEGMEITWT